MGGELDILVLIGPNGVGKSTVGRALGETGEFTFVDLEGFFVSEYGSMEAYAADRQAAYSKFEATIRAAVSTGTSKPVVFEELGMSQPARQMLSALRRDCRTALVGLCASEGECVRRAATRASSGLFQKSDAYVVNTWRSYQESAPSRTFDLELDTVENSLEAVVDAVRKLTRKIPRRDGA